MNKLAKCGLYMQWNTGLFPGATSGKEPACQGDVRDTGLILGPGRFFGNPDAPVQRQLALEARNNIQI